MTGAELITAERQRQLEAEGWSANHDDIFDNEELINAAIAYALAHPGEEAVARERRGMQANTEAQAWWPWSFEWWKPRDRIRNLVRAGALIAAEIDRLQRLAAG